jgi:hypothetical protein
VRSRESSTPPSDGRIDIYVSIGNDYYSASYTFSTEGEFIEKYGTGLD